MIGNLAAFLALVAAMVLFGWLVKRAWGARRGFVKWPGVVLAGLLTLIFAFGSVLAARGLYALYAPRSFPVAQIKVAATPDQLARGEHLAAVACAGCHSATAELPLMGGKNLGDEANMPLGSVYPPNLTPGGELKSWSDGEIIRAIREGTHRSGRPLVKPNVQALSKISDADVQAIVAYLRNQPAVVNVTPEANPSLLLAILLGAGIFSADAQPVTSPVVAPPKAVTKEYGAYVVNYMGCADCHGKHLDGKTSGIIPPAPDVRPMASVPRDVFAGFVRARATGGAAGGMPWKEMSKLDEEEMGAMHLFLSSLPK